MLRGLNILLNKATETLDEWYEQGFGLVETTYKLGNNTVLITDTGTCLIYYYDTVVGGFDYELGIWFANNRGFNTKSTNRIVNDIKEWVKPKIYLLNEVDVETFEKYTEYVCEVGEKI